MNRRDAIKAAVAGVAGAMLPECDSVPPHKLMKLSLPPKGTPWVMRAYPAATATVEVTWLHSTDEE